MGGEKSFDVSESDRRFRALQRVRIRQLWFVVAVAALGGAGLALLGLLAPVSHLSDLVGGLRLGDYYVTAGIAFVAVASYGAWRLRTESFKPVSRVTLSPTGLTFALVDGRSLNAVWAEEGGGHMDVYDFRRNPAGRLAEVPCVLGVELGSFRGAMGVTPELAEEFVAMATAAGARTTATVSPDFNRREILLPGVVR